MSPGPLSSQSALHVVARRRSAAVSEAPQMESTAESTAWSTVTIRRAPSSSGSAERRHTNDTIELGREESVTHRARASR